MSLFKLDVKYGYIDLGLVGLHFAELAKGKFQ